MDGVRALVVGAGNVKANSMVGALTVASPAVKPNPLVAGAGVGVGVLDVSPPAGVLPNAGDSEGAAAPKLDPFVVKSSAAGQRVGRTRSSGT
jgi:hypothetical protein